MSLSIRSLLRRTPAYAWLWRRRRLRALRAWTANDQRLVSFFGEFLGRGDLCFDVGANVGNRTKIFRRLGARVIAFEPQGKCAALLAAAFRDDSDVQVVRAAMGAEKGSAVLNVGDADTVATLSTDWIKAVTSTGRFGDHVWNRSERVQVETLDAMIERYGIPAFIKIDVEGFEDRVVAGMHRPVRAVSLEFASEYMDGSLRALAHLAKLGDCRLNYSRDESLQMALPEWLGHDAFIACFEPLRHEQGAWGDIYVRFTTT